MKNNVIWYLHHYAGGKNLDGFSRPYYLCKELNKHYCKTYIMRASFHHFQRSLIPQEHAFHHDIIDQQDYIFFKTPSYQGNGYRRVINMFSYAWKIWRYQRDLIKITGIPSVIIVSSAHPYHYLSALSIAKKYNAKIIFEVRDLWPMSLVELLNVSPYHPLVLLTGWVEKLAYKHSDHVVSVLSNALPYMVQKGLSPERFVYIPNGTAVDALDKKMPLPENYEQLIASKKQQGLFLIGYTGSHGVPNALDELLAALIILKKENIQSVHFFLVGSGGEKEKLSLIAKENGLTSVTFLDSLPRNRVLTFLDKMDAVYLGWKNNPIYAFGISPNKIFDYMLAAKPILHAIASGTVADILVTPESSVLVPAGNAAEISNGIKKIATMPKNELQAMGKRGQQIVYSSFSYEYLGKAYLELLQPEPGLKL